MSIGPRDLLIYTMVGLTLAVAVNHYAGLNVPFLNTLERAIVPPSERGLNDQKKYFDYTESKGAVKGLSAECQRAKTRGDAKVMIRNAIKNAKAEKDTYKVRELEEKLREIENAEREACR